MYITQQSRGFRLDDAPGFKRKMLNWLKRFSIFCYLDNQAYAIAPQQAECLVAAGAERFVSGADLRVADAFLQPGRWAFGHLSYELNHAQHGLASAKQDEIDFSPLYFFEPQTVLEIKGDLLVVYASDPGEIFAQISGETDEPDTPRETTAAPAPVLGRADSTLR